MDNGAAVERDSTFGLYPAPGQRGTVAQRGAGRPRLATRGRESAGFGALPVPPAAEPPTGRRGRKGRRTLRPSSIPYACVVLPFWPVVAFRCVIRWFGRAEASAVSRRESWNAAEQDRGRDTRPAGGVRVKTLRIAGGTPTTLPRIQKCSCDGSGWFVSLNRDRYRSPGDAGMLRLTRCLCLEHTPSPARRGGAGAV